MTTETRDVNRIERRHYIIGALVISAALLIQPFSLLATQMYLAPKIAPYFIKNNNNQQAGETNYAGKEISTTNLKVQGNKDAEIYLVEYSDYQCPFCQRFHETPKAIVAGSNGKVAWAYKHFPLQFHPNAEPAAVAAECVNKLAGTEKFWKFSDVLVANQEKLSETLYKTESAKLGVNGAVFAICLKDKQMLTNVQADQTEGSSLGVNGTPSTFVVKNENGKLIILENINGALPQNTVESILTKYVK